jgi:hypothetical protein
MFLCVLVHSRWSLLGYVTHVQRTETSWLLVSSIRYEAIVKKCAAKFLSRSQRPSKDRRVLTDGRNLSASERIHVRDQTVR